MKWLKDNIIQIILILITVTFGYASFTKDIQKNASDIFKLDNKVDKFESKLDKAIMLLERIDERTSKKK